MFNSTHKLRVSRKGIMRMNDAQTKNIEALKTLVEKIDKCTIEQIPMEYKCQFTAKIHHLRTEIAYSENQSDLQTQIADLENFINDVASGKYRSVITSCDNIDDLRSRPERKSR